MILRLVEKYQRDIEEVGELRDELSEAQRLLTGRGYSTLLANRLLESLERARTLLKRTSSLSLLYHDVCDVSIMGLTTYERFCQKAVVDVN